MRFSRLGPFGRGNSDETCTVKADDTGFLALIGLTRKAGGVEDHAAMEAALHAGLLELEAQRQWYASEAQQACWKQFDSKNIWKFDTEECRPVPCDLNVAPLCETGLELDFGPIWDLKEEEVSVWTCRRTVAAGGHITFVLEEAEEGQKVVEVPQAVGVAEVQHAIEVVGFQQ